MGWGGAIEQVGKFFNNFTKGRRGRIRITIQELKDKKKRIMSSPPSTGKSKKVQAIVKKIKKLERILNQE